MSLILHLETATTVCSVALSFEGKLISLKEENNGYTHAEHLSLFIEDVLLWAGKKMTDIDAVAISKGPGSYTGLRIGVATAKGICYGLNKPLIAVNTLLSLANIAADKYGDRYLICPMLDARRMEVYTAVFNSGKMIFETTALILDEQAFSNLLSTQQIVFLGDGAHKFQSLCDHTNAIFDTSIEPSAKGMINNAYQQFKLAQFEDSAYFEPFYLKEFYTPAPVKSK
jgi:tRNA threonylcarbamoyladenosine biosynthesis protein TsaB